MSDSIDRVFVKAISTIRALSTRAGSGSLPRPPVDSRIRLYGLYKQATEGNVEGIMDRPQGSRAEDESARHKWDAWKSEEGISKTEAKRRYISFLIDTMKSYASGTHDARELLSELEYLWDQIKDVDPTPTPPMTPRMSTYGSLYGSTYGGFDDMRSEMRDVAQLKREVAGALRKVNQELDRNKNGDKGKEWEGVKNLVKLLFKICAGVVKRMAVDLVVVLLVLKLIKLKRGVGLNVKDEPTRFADKPLLWLLKLLTNVNLLDFDSIRVIVS